MADNTKIEWTDATWNPITGCSVISPGCTNCYAMKVAGTRLKHHPSRKGLTTPTKAGPVWNGQVRLNEDWLDQPMRWRKPRMIFVCAHGDLFHEAVPDEWIDRVFAVMALCPQHVFQVLTKRADRMRSYLTIRNGMGHESICRPINDIPNKLGNRHGALEMPLPNVWLGVSVEDQKRAEERIPLLLQTPAALRWISAEPLIGPLDLTIDGLSCWPCPYCEDGSQIEWDTGANACRRCDGSGKGDELGIDWVVVGGESGNGARPMHPDWAFDLRNQCVKAGVPFFFKQWGEWHSAREHDPTTHSHDVETVAMNRRGEVVWSPGEVFRLGADLTQDDWQTFCRLGKAQSGRVLDEIHWYQMPDTAQLAAQAAE